MYSRICKTVYIALDEMYFARIVFCLQHKISVKAIECLFSFFLMREKFMEKNTRSGFSSVFNPPVQFGFSILWVHPRSKMMMKIWIVCFVDLIEKNVSLHVKNQNGQFLQLCAGQFFFFLLSTKWVGGGHHYSNPLGAWPCDHRGSLPVVEWPIRVISTVYENRPSLQHHQCKFIQ